MSSAQAQFADLAVAELPLTVGTALLRPARPDDKPRIRRAFGELDAETRYSRFLGYKNEVSEAELTHITECDFIRDAAYLVTIPHLDDEIVIGGASAFALDDASPPKSAEVAFTIEEDYQGQGLATALMRRLIAFGRRAGFETLEAEVLSTNQGMLLVFKHAGLPIRLRMEEGVTHVTLRLDAADDAPAI